MMIEHDLLDAKKRPLILTKGRFFHAIVKLFHFSFDRFKPAYFTFNAFFLF